MEVNKRSRFDRIWAFLNDGRGGRCAYGIKKLLDIFQGNGDMAQGLLAIAGVVISVIAFVSGVAVVIVVLVVAAVGLIKIGRCFVKWYRRRKSKRRYGVCNQLLTHQYQVIKENVRLESLFVTSAKLRIGAAAEDKNTTICLSIRTPSSLSFQVQTKDEHSLKCVHVILEQSGENVVARSDWAAYISPDHDVGYDFVSDGSFAHNVPIGENGYSVACLRFKCFSKMRPKSTPVEIYNAGRQGRWSAICSVGSGLNVDLDWRGDSSRASSCLKIEYSNSGNGCAEAVWRDPQYNCGEVMGGANLDAANELVFRARGAAGGEEVCFFLGGMRNCMVSDSVDECAINVCLKPKWKTYRILLRGVDLSRIKTAFGVRFKGKGKSCVLVDNVVYKYSFLRAVFCRRPTLEIGREIGTVRTKGKYGRLARRRTCVSECNGVVAAGKVSRTTGLPRMVAEE